MKYETPEMKVSLIAGQDDIITSSGYTPNPEDALPET